MSDAKSPVYFRTIPCPACAAKTSQAKFKTGMYVEEERESDQHVTRYRWLQPDVTPLHPPFYALSHCPECTYTDFNDDFAEPNRSRENRVRVLAPRLKAELARRGSAIWILHRDLGPGPIDFPAALRRHLLAIAIQELLPAGQRDHLRLARLSLRTAWLYRERGSAAGAAVAENEDLQALDAVAARLKDLRTAADRLVTVYAGRAGGTGVDTFANQVEALGRGYADFRSKLVSPGNGGDPLAFLAAVRGEWPEVPTGEGPCLETAVRAFEEVYQRGDGDTLPLLKLMIELNYRLGRFDRVLDYSSAMSRSGHEERTALQRQLDTDRSLTPEQRSRLTVRINQIGAMLQLASDIRRQALARQAATAAASSTA